MAITAKNARDLWLRFKVLDIQGTGQLNQYVLVRWASEPALLAGGAGRQSFNAWPYDATTEALATEYVSTVPVFLYVPQESWDLLGLYRVLYYQLGYGQTPVIDSSWTWSAVGQLVINHPPLANPGPSRVFSLDPSDQLIDPLELDGSGTTDDDMATSYGMLRDPGPLSFKWEVAAGAGVAALPWQTANFNKAVAVALPARTTIPPASLGVYTFRLRVEDTDVPLATSSKGVDQDEVQHTLQRYGGGVFIFSPTTLAPRTFQFVEELDVPITYKVDPGLLADPQFAGGWWAELTIREPLTGSVVVTRLTPVPPTDIEGHFSWDGVYDDFNRPTSGQQFDVRVRALDYNAQPINIPGRRTVDTQANAIRINVTNVTIGAAATKAVDYDRLIAGTALCTLPVTIDTPGGALPPDALSLEVLDLSGGVLGTVPVMGIPAQITWNGSIGAGKLPAPAHVQVRVIARRGGQVLARSNLHDIKAVKLELEVTSPVQAVVGGRQVHVIPYATAETPTFTVRVKMTGLTPEDLLTQTAEARLEVRYVQGNRNDLHMLPGPSPNDFQTLPAGINAWIAYFPGITCGGDLTVFCRATIDGVLLERATPPNGHAVWGENPPKATVRGYGGRGLNYHVVLHRESRFTQFSATAAVGTLNGYQPGPLTVLHTFDDGLGIGQLTAAPIGSDEIWSWQKNVDEPYRRLDQFRANAVTYQQQVQLGQPFIHGVTGGIAPNSGVAFPAAPAFTNDQLNLEMWARYNGFYRYHNFDPVSGTWVRRLPPGMDAGTSLIYADEVMAVLQQANAGVFPAGW